MSPSISLFLPAEAFHRAKDERKTEGRLTSKQRRQRRINATRRETGFAANTLFCFQKLETFCFSIRFAFMLRGRASERKAEEKKVWKGASSRQRTSFSARCVTGTTSIHSLYRQVSNSGLRDKFGPRCNCTLPTRKYKKTLVFCFSC